MACRDHAMSSALFISHVRWAFAVGREDYFIFERTASLTDAADIHTRGAGPCLRSPRQGRHHTHWTTAHHAAHRARSSLVRQHAIRPLPRRRLACCPHTP